MVWIVVLHCRVLERKWWGLTITLSLPFLVSDGFFLKTVVQTTLPCAVESLAAIKIACKATAVFEEIRLDYSCVPLPELIKQASSLRHWMYISQGGRRWEQGSQAPAKASFYRLTEMVRFFSSGVLLLEYVNSMRLKWIKSLTMIIMVSL